MMSIVNNGKILSVLLLRIKVFTQNLAFCPPKS